MLVRWGSTSGQPFVGVGPTSWAHTTARLQSEAEKALADESGGPISNLLPIPQDGGSGDEDDPLVGLKADIAAARGRALLVETVNAGWGEGRMAAPQADWQPRRLGPNPTSVQATVAQQSFERTLAACGVPPSLFISDDGTAQREAVRRWHLGTVIPLADLLAWELTTKFETPVTLRFDSYPLDLAGRAQASKNLVAGGMAVEQALGVSGLMVDNAA